MFTYSVKNSGNRSTLSVSGRIDAVSKSEFEKALKELMSNDPMEIDFNFAGLTFLDSSGMGTFLSFYKTNKYKNEEKRKFTIIAINDDLKNFFKLLHVDSIIPIQ